MIVTTAQALARDLAAIGYKIDPRCSFNYRNTYNGQPYDARSCYIVEADTGVSFAHYKDARRDANYEKLREMRRNEYLIKGRIYEL